MADDPVVLVAEGDAATDGNPGVDASTGADAAPDGSRDAGRDFLYAFVTANTHVGQFAPPPGSVATNGLAGADAYCKTSADEAVVATVLKGRKWVAWLSVYGQLGGVDAWQRLPKAQTGERDLGFEYRLHDGATQIFPKGFYLGAQPSEAGTSYPLPKHPINLDENHGSAPSYTVWTGTEYNKLGAYQLDCGGWNAGNYATLTGGTGDSNPTNPPFWTLNSDVGGKNCSEAHSLYCFEVP